jgi:hypothetical protein
MLNTTSENQIDVLDFDSFVALMDGNKSARFVSLLYRAKGTGELARHTILLNVNRDRCLRVDLANLQKHRLTLKPGVEAQACDELIASITETLTTGQNSQYTKKGYYEGQGNGNVQVSVKRVCYIRGYSVSKQVIEEGEYTVVKSAPKTIAKNKLRKTLKNTQIREFLITPENFKVARHDGKAIFVDASASGLSRLANLPPVTLAVPVSA